MTPEQRNNRRRAGKLGRATPPKLKPVDTLGMGAQRELSDNGDGTYTLKVTPSKWVGGAPQTVLLTAKQVVGFREWERGKAIHKALPSLTAEQREIIISGLSPEAFKLIEERDED